MRQVSATFVFKRFSFGQRNRCWISPMSLYLVLLPHVLNPSECILATLVSSATCTHTVRKCRHYGGGKV